MEELHSLRRDEWDSTAASESLESDVISELGCESLESLTLGASTANAGTSANDTGVNGTSNTVLLLNVELGQVEKLGILISKVLFHISSG